MKITELKVGMKVKDRCWSARRFWGVGTVKKVLKTRVHIKYHDRVRVYDIPHLQFLEPHLPL